jgi:hypothetical protein
METAVMSQAFFTDPLGSWPSDLHDILHECRTLSASPNSYIQIYNEELIIKTILKRNSGDVDKQRLGVKSISLSLATIVPFLLSATASLVG